MDRCHRIEREVQDLMKVESFSQLPFIRPAPLKEKPIRLFGRDFGGHAGSSSGETSNPSEERKETENGETNRRFECHYCCRNFPTSQALGGHQNAHKRERQNAKRAHLDQNAHVYSFTSYGLGSAASTRVMTYPSWNNNRGGVPSNGSSSFSQHPINGSPLALWRVPSAVHHSNSSFSCEPSFYSFPLFASSELKMPPQVGDSGTQSRYVYASKTSVQEQVSLDLRL